MLLAGIVIAKGVSIRIRSADKSQFVVIKVHWAPPFVSTGVITNFLSGYGTVVYVAFNKCVSKRFEGVATSVRSARGHDRKPEGHLSRTEHLPYQY